MFRMWSFFSCGVVCGLLERQVPESWPQPLFSVPLAHNMCDGQCVSCISELSSVLACHPSCLSEHWDLAFLDAYADSASSGKCIHVCKRVCACNCVTVHLSTWTLNPSLINVRGLRQALYASFCRDRQIIGPPGVRVGTTHDASTKTAPPFVKQTCAIHTASALC